MARESNFSDLQKAAIFVRDRATCAYSGRNLWILDGGATPKFPVDWADHIVPVSKGGLSTLENGVCSNWYENKKKMVGEVPVQFINGKPTDPQRRLSPDQLKDIERLGNLRLSDWFFNRALFRLLLGVDYLHKYVDLRARNDRYYATSSFEAIKRWKTVHKKNADSSLEDRGLAPASPTPDQQTMLHVRLAKSEDDIREAMVVLLPIYSGEAISRR
jgi:hypothetical protein